MGIKRIISYRTTDGTIFSGPGARAKAELHEKNFLLDKMKDDLKRSLLVLLTEESRAKDRYPDADGTDDYELLFDELMDMNIAFNGKCPDVSSFITMLTDIVMKWTDEMTTFVTQVRFGKKRMGKTNV